MSNNKKVLVLFSGGMDSTFLLYRNLKAGNDVCCLRNVILNNKIQTEKETKAVEKIIEWLRSRFPNHSITYNEEFMRFGINAVEDEAIFVQPVLWLTSLYAYLQRSYNFDYVEYGLISRDDGLSYIDDLKKIFDDLMMIPGMEQMKGKLSFPIIKYHKLDIIYELPKELLKLTTSCEGVSNNKFCNHCHSCKVLKDALNSGDLNLNRKLNSDEEIKEYELNREKELTVKEVS